MYENGLGVENYKEALKWYIIGRSKQIHMHNIILLWSQNLLNEQIFICLD